MEVPDPPEASCILTELSESVRPVGVTNADRLTSPAKPLWLPRVIVDVPDEPDWMVKVAGLEVTLKSPTVTVTVTV
jgi:hypothetical protein